MIGRGILPNRFVTRSSLLWLCVVAFLACESRSAWASCGDHLHGRPLVRHGDFQMNLPVDPILASRHSTPDQRPICSGPQCQRNRQTPLTPSKAVQVPTYTDAILQTLSGVSPEETAAFGNPSDAAPLAGPVGRIFRPPRAA